MTELNLEPLQTILAEFSPQGRTALLPALHAAQAIYGYLPEAVAAEVGRTLNVPLADVFGVIDFYALFYREPVARTVIHVCDDPACAMAGADRLLKMMSQKKVREKVGDRMVETVTVERAPCLGLCEHAPAMLVQGVAFGGATVDSYKQLAAGKGRRPETILGGSLRLLTANCGRRHPTSLPEYEQGGGYQALKRALEWKPERVIAEIKAAGLVGRGGAAFPTAAKWESAARAAGQTQYVVCNADEAEPGTFKDRVMMEDDPHRILEGLIIAAYAIGAQKDTGISAASMSTPYEMVRDSR